MSNLIKFHQHVRHAHLAGQPAAEPPPKPEVDLAAVEKKAYERGRTEAENKFKEMIAAAQTLQGELLANLQKAEKELVETVETALPDLIIEGIRRIIPQWSPEVREVQKIVRDMLSGLEGESGPLEIRLNEQDKAQLEQLQNALEGDFGQTNLVVDRNLRRGECVVVGRFGMVDGRFQSKLNGLRKDLL
ncbi:MAG: hypothetical protein LAT55_00725 [Opitutales bacterium]|nr:hypothetical protein [Opitutales bacterium]